MSERIKVCLVVEAVFERGTQEDRDSGPRCFQSWIEHAAMEAEADSWSISSVQITREPIVNEE